jgi:hypothetical protein
MRLHWALAVLALLGCHPPGCEPRKSKRGKAKYAMVGGGGASGVRTPFVVREGARRFPSESVAGRSGAG